MTQTRTMDVDLLVPGRYQPREQFDGTALQELADTIAEQGLVQPIVVRPLESGRYEILAGERRWRAAQLAGIHQVEVLIREGITDEQALRISIAENVQREDLTPIEEARAYARLRDEFGMSQGTLAETVGKNRTHVAHMLRLLTLEDAIQQLLQSRALDVGHGKALLAAPAGLRMLLAREAAAKGLTVRQTEDRIDNWLNREKTKQRQTKPDADPDIRRLNEELSHYLGVIARVEKKGKAVHLRLRFIGIDNLNGALEKLGSQAGGALEIQANKTGKGEAVLKFSSNGPFNRWLERLDIGQQ